MSMIPQGHLLMLAEGHRQPPRADTPSPIMALDPPQVYSGVISQSTLWWWPSEGLLYSNEHLELLCIYISLLAP